MKNEYLTNSAQLYDQPMIVRHKNYYTPFKYYFKQDLFIKVIRLQNKTKFERSYQHS